MIEKRFGDVLKMEQLSYGDEAAAMIVERMVLWHRFHCLLSQLPIVRSQDGGPR